MRIRKHNGIEYGVLKSWRSLVPGTNNRYRLLKPAEVQTAIYGFAVRTQYIALFHNGRLALRAGYEWDGPSGCTIDTKTFMRGSLFHDPLFELIRLELIPYWVKASADVLLRQICLADGMSRIRAAYVYHAVRNASDFAAMPQRRNMKSLAVVTVALMMLCSCDIIQPVHELVDVFMPDKVAHSGIVEAVTWDGGFYLHRV